MSLWFGTVRYGHIAVEPPPRETNTVSGNVGGTGHKDEEKRLLVGCFVEGMELDPVTSTVDI